MLICKKINFLSIKLKLVFNLNADLKQIKIEDAIAQSNRQILWKGISEGGLISLIIHQFHDTTLLNSLYR